MEIGGLCEGPVARIVRPRYHPVEAFGRALSVALFCSNGAGSRKRNSWSGSGWLSVFGH